MGLTSATVTIIPGIITGLLLIFVPVVIAGLVTFVVARIRGTWPSEIKERREGKITPRFVATDRKPAWRK